MIKVVKFGGSSLADAVQFRKAAEIIRSDASRRYVVASAPGKRNSHDEKVTDLLLQCFRLASEKRSIDDTFEKIENRYREIIHDLGLDCSLEAEFAGIKTAILHHAGSDYIASRGEYLNSKLLAKYLDFPFVDAEDGIFFDENGVLDAEKTNKELTKILELHEYAVIPGFYGILPNGTIKTFSRGGSDITGSIVAAATKADIYENWTDVSGMLMADPRCIEAPRPIPEITYRELRELSYMGATVLHQDAIFPVRNASIPINIKNTNDPSAKGTMIVPEAPEGKNEHIITGIAGKKHFSAICIEKDEMNSEIGFLRRVLTLMESENISFEHIPTGIDTMNIIVNSDDLKAHPNFADRVKEVACPNHIEIEHNLALIAVVGRGMKATKGTATRIFAALSHANINIKMIATSEIKISVLVAQKDAEAAVVAIHDKFMLK